MVEGGGAAESNLRGAIAVDWQKVIDSLIEHAKCIREIRGDCERARMLVNLATALSCGLQK